MHFTKKNSSEKRLDFVKNLQTKKIIEYVLALLLVLTGIFILIK